VTSAIPESDFLVAPGLRLAVYDSGGTGIPVVLSTGSAAMRLRSPKCFRTIRAGGC